MYTENKNNCCLILYSIFYILLFICFMYTYAYFFIQNKKQIQNFYQDGEETVQEQGEYTEFSRLEIKVGKILEVEKHPDADGLYVEKIDVGEEEPRTIVSGLVKFIEKEDFEGMSTLVLCNLKPRAMRGITSAGMVLCASNEDHTKVWPLLAPEGSTPGDIVRVEGHQYKPDPAGNRAGKAFTKVADDLHVNDDLEATYKGGKFTTTKGIIKSTMKGSIS